MNRRSLILALVALVALPLVRPLAAGAQSDAPILRRPALRLVARRQRDERRAERGQLPPRWMERLRRMSPAEQERFLENNRRFRSLPPERQAEIRARLKQWNRLTPRQKRTLIRRARILDRMSPRERREIRRVILPEWRRLPPDRRTVIVRKLRQLQPLTDSQRRKRLEDPRFVQGLSPKERDLLDQLSKLRVGSGEENR